MAASPPFDAVLAALRAVAEPTRLRLVDLLTHGELTVGEICAVLEQSQPRISRHLKLLCDAGVLDRFREEHWVYYRAATEGLGGDVTRQLVSWVPRDDALLRADQRRLATVLAERVKAAIANSEAKGREVRDPNLDGSVDELDAALSEHVSGEPIGELLDIGTGTGWVLRALGANASRAVGVDISSDALRIARTHTHTAGLSHCLFRRGDMYALPFARGSFDTVTMDRVLADAERPESALAEAARMLRAGGRLCLVEDFDALADRLNANPLSVLRTWLANSQLHCERIAPLDTEGGHWIIVIGRAHPAVQQAA